jgi:hypothetical protein
VCHRRELSTLVVWLVLGIETLAAGLPAEAAALPPGAVRVAGNTLLDPCGAPIVVKGVEQVFGWAIDVRGSWLTLVDEIARSGANAIRVLPNVSQLQPSDVDQILARATGHQLIVFLSPGDRTWLGRSEVKPVLQKYRPWLVLDAFQEPTYDDPDRWQTEAMAAVRTIRGYGYPGPVTVVGNQYGRDLPSILARGSAMAASDPQVIFGWQAYWGQSGWYASWYDLSLAEGIEASSKQSFPVQIGVTSIADPGDPMDYQEALTEAHRHGVGWLWWNWYNPFGPSAFNVSADGTMAGLTSHGQVVVQTHPNGFHTAVKACASQVPLPPPTGLRIQRD